jgi:hypothetical protein
VETKRSICFHELNHKLLAAPRRCMCFYPKRNEVTGEWRRLHNKERYALYSAPDIICVVSWAGPVIRMGERRGAYRVDVGKP